MTKKSTEDVFGSIFLLQKEHTLPLLEFIWARAGLLTEEEEEEEVVVLDFVIVEVMVIIIVEVVMEDVMEEVAVVIDADDPLLHTIEAVVVAVLEGIIVQDPDLIHLVDIERGQMGDAPCPLANDVICGWPLIGNFFTCEI